MQAKRLAGLSGKWKCDLHPILDKKIRTAWSITDPGLKMEEEVEQRLESSSDSGRNCIYIYIYPKVCSIDL